MQRLILLSLAMAGWLAVSAPGLSVTPNRTPPTHKSQVLRLLVARHLLSARDLSQLGGYLFRDLEQIGLKISLRPARKLDKKAMITIYEPKPMLIRVTPLARPTPEMSEFLSKWTLLVAGARLDTSRVLRTPKTLTALYRMHLLFWLSRQVFMHVHNLYHLYARVGGFAREEMATQITVALFDFWSTKSVTFRDHWRQYTQFLVGVYQLTPEITRKTKTFDEEAFWTINGIAIGPVRYHSLILRGVMRALKRRSPSPGYLVRHLIAGPARWMITTGFDKKQVHDALTSFYSARRTAAIVALYYHGLHGALKALVKVATSDPSPGVRLAALSTLLKYPDKAALDAYKTCKHRYAIMLRARCRRVLVKKLGIKKL